MIQTKPLRIYVCGPMTGREWFNFPAFDDMATWIAKAGHTPVSPADLDRAAGLNPYGFGAGYDWNVIPGNMSLSSIVERDMKALLSCDGYVLLDGWEDSKGAKAEKGVLDWRGTPRLDPERNFVVWEDVTPCDQAACAAGVSVPAELDKLKKAVTKTEIHPGWKTAEIYPGQDKANPKDALGQAKTPIHLVPAAFIIHVAEAMRNGAEKYGPYNFRETKPRLSVYVSAALRHIHAYFDGEELAPDSKLPHLAHAAANMAILLDCMSRDGLIDDRPKGGRASEILKSYERSAK